ncbi:hypothetical protein A33Q_0771 [Indibacter alkaliphilus LW1]|uniref:Uncharacterized protein n=1 Tax=Indibacter alkaliphilus (strain CCUG 57479 / KCTC 22604 / LW1) TaxID=1189612 RepID=S2E9V0_INDAL|nr:hypothetical protein A33Q_0771 [Indibacter alkaliphilus LW1]
MGRYQFESNSQLTEAYRSAPQAVIPLGRYQFESNSQHGHA